MILKLPLENPIHLCYSIQDRAINVDKIPVLKSKITQPVTPQYPLMNLSPRLFSAKTIDTTDFRILYLRENKNQRPTKRNP